MCRNVIVILTMLAFVSQARASTPTTESDPAEDGREGLALVNALGAAYEKRESNATCLSTKPSYQESAKHSYRRYSDKTQKTEDKFQCIFFKDDPSPLQVKHYLDAGFALSDLYCKNFFRRVSSHSQSRGFARNNVNDVGASISVILGLAKAGSVVTGGLGAIFGLADGIFRTYDQQFLVSPDLANVQKLVFAAQYQFRVKYKTQQPDNYYEAASVIAEHANMCSFLGMKVLINTSLTKNTETTVNNVSDAADTSSIAASAANFIVVRDQIETFVKQQKDKEAAAAAAAEKAASAKVEADKAAADKAAADKAAAIPVPQ